MQVDAIGAQLGSAEQTQSTINQDDFIELFLAQLTFQDPLEPVDNREFLAQMAQFASLEQSRLSTESLEALTQLNSTSQATGLLGRTVNLNIESETGSTTAATVTAINYTQAGASLTVTLSNGSSLDGIPISQVVTVIRDLEANSGE
ncbi:MAG: flagellar hook capping FlgD N-terminal domain-containing protein [Pseudomonadota bacterium]